MEDIKKQAELYAESFRYKIDDAGWYEQKVRDFIAGYEAALHAHNAVGRNEQLCECYDSHEINQVEIVEICCRCKKPTT